MGHSKFILGIRGAPAGPMGQNCIGTCGIGGVRGYSGDGGLDRDDFLDTGENNLARLFFFLSVFPSATPSSTAAANGSPNFPSINVMVLPGSRSINLGRS